MKGLDVKIKIDTNNPKDYITFIKCKQLPVYKVKGNIIYTNKDSYNLVFGKKKSINYDLSDYDLFDYQKYLVEKALNTKKYAVFAECGLGKTRVELAFANSINGKVIYFCPLSVMDDIMEEAKTMNIEISNLRYNKWESKIGLINFEGLKHVDLRGVTGMVLDESSILKNDDGKIRKYLTEIASNMEYRLACSATPSPNEQNEYATHSVFLGYSGSLKEFYSQYFRKDGTHWVIKSHAIEPFYDHLSKWACYIKSPSSLGFELGAELKEEPEYIELHTKDHQYFIDETLFADNIGLSEANSKIFSKLRSDPKTERFKVALDAIKNDQSIIWCNRNAEEELYYKALKDKAVLITGKTNIEKRHELLQEYKKGNIQYLISKPSILGFGVNLQQTDSILYTGYNFSFEQFYQAVRRAHRYGRKNRLKVYIPIANIENPIWILLNNKLRVFEQDIERLQSRFFKEFKEKENEKKELFI
jgi:superfamily II DNA or RNA helicase